MEEKKGRHWVKAWKGRLGPLQIEIMHLVFGHRKNGTTARDVFEIMYDRQKLPMSSVYTVLSRLIKRGVLERKKVDEVYHYYSLIQKRDLSKFGSFEEKRYRQGTIDLISSLIRREIANDPAEIDKLQKFLDQERKRIQKRQ